MRFWVVVVHTRREKPFEDFYMINEEKRIALVADGVTRDWDELLKREKFDSYPNPSPARIAAEILCKEVSEYLRNCKNPDERDIKKAFEIANKEIANWNSENNPKPDYLLRDFAGCAASCAVECKGIIYFGFLTDCGVAIFDKNGALKFRTENEGPDKYDSYIWKDKRLEKIGWENPEARKVVRRDYRNNPSEPNSFGVLTGEREAMNYVRIGNQRISTGECVAVYSDGAEQFVFSKECSEMIRRRDFEGLMKLCKSSLKKEGTLILGVAQG